ncbi:colanic acid biosynthesis protein [Clostridium puniceum]|uniref:Colanic acid biosynthesis protein n=1 Tax=Clostridium puniceum TaxID=29367 RepID=A0A1S8TDM9_9CLOT|nr:polysaccharide pyruvyl transferase family protein [Clostridium puniceum]OOM75816.1 colanic acid biosynthesis protein [Clostridium puniceum]
MKNESNIINIGLYDMDFFDLNLGVNALGICHILMLEKISQQMNINIKYTIFTVENEQKVVDLFESLVSKKLYVRTVHPISIRHVGILFNFYNEVKKCDLVIDATGGDSFSDIYGNTRFIRGTICKIITSNRSQLLLAPQTIGPFTYKFNERFAAYAMKRAKKIYVRDELTYEYVHKIAPKCICELASDVAMGLPFDKSKYDTAKVEGYINVGINVSGLLWNGGYTGSNQFDLTLDYQKFMKTILKQLLKANKYKIHLIAHVIEEGAYEDDYKVCKDLANQYTDIILAPKFTNPIDAKNYICHMDVFAGARMHSTIGAFSSGVATIPIAYSRKFAGVFGSLGYNVGIDCKKMNTDEAILEFLRLVEEYLKIQSNVIVSLKIAKERIENYEIGLKKLISKLAL